RRPTSDEAAREDDPGFEGPEAYNDPEIRPLAERCLVGFSSTSGPPILPTYFYNNLHQIVQTRDSVMILTEMVHDARVVRMTAHERSLVRVRMPRRELRDGQYPARRAVEGDGRSREEIQVGFNAESREERPVEGDTPVRLYGPEPRKRRYASLPSSS